MSMDTNADDNHDWERYLVDTIDWWTLATKAQWWTVAAAGCAGFGLGVVIPVSGGATAWLIWAASAVGVACLARSYLMMPRPRIGARKTRGDDRDE